MTMFYSINSNNCIIATKKLLAEIEKKNRKSGLLGKPKPESKNFDSNMGHHFVDSKFWVLKLKSPLVRLPKP